MTDRRVFFTVVVTLGVTLIACVVAIAALAAGDNSVPGILENLAVGSLTGLAGLLARTPTAEPQEVTVTNKPGAPVAVEEVDP